jgi:DNA polymerase
VKHFKFEARGKRRLHKRPNVYGIERCRIWLDAERILVKPEIVVALGATSARSVMGRAVTVSGLRGRIIDLPERGRGLVTIHPSWVLRIENETDKAREYRRFVTDLEIVRKSLMRH